MIPFVILTIGPVCFIYSVFVIFYKHSLYALWWKLSASILFMGQLLIAIKLMYPPYLDAQNVLHEPYFIVLPIGFLMLIVGSGMVLILTALSKIRSRSKKLSDSSRL
ncbi:DUF3955 domain-containing protein [Brucella gallinifaecis]|uniref:DUF3955 domain-containing protein n=1 Tax=Brucella gallinifaecis TaxID=215590 RepID=A0A502BJM4_9HYPH|nr:DUF3955 domain-containing protein [Brucella gallinifaecis]